MIPVIHGGLRYAVGMKTYLHGPTDHAKTLKLRFRVGDLDLPERRKRYWYTSSRVEGKKMNRCALEATQYLYIVELAKWENVKYTRRNGMC